MAERNAVFVFGKAGYPMTSSREQALVEANFLLKQRIRRLESALEWATRWKLAAKHQRTRAEAIGRFYEHISAPPPPHPAPDSSFLMSESGV